MKKIYLIVLVSLLFSFSVSSQQHFCSKAKQTSTAGLMQHQKRTSALAPQISHELKYDVKFVHLMLNSERTTKYISGGVKTVATVTATVLDTFACLLHQNHTIDSVRFNGALLPATRKDSMIKVVPAIPLTNGQSFTVTVYYKGTPPTGGSGIGDGLNTGTSSFSFSNQATWSLSEPFVAYHWWPCKQILTDKIDSSWVDVTTDSLNKVGSNGLLKNVVTIGSKKRYEWKSKYPIDYYLISIAVAKYKEYNLYAHPLYLPNDSILIQNFIYDNVPNNSMWNSEKLNLDKMPQVLEFESKMYGMYPFYKEKYGHCMAPIPGGMEHQTMTSLGFFDYYIDAHELGHHWWGDNVTCKSWGDVWINEGFATYTEHLVAQYLDAPNYLPNLNTAHNNVMSQPGGSIYFTGSDTLNLYRIFDSRLTYDKGGAIINTLRFVTNNDSLWFNTLRGFQNTYKNSTASAVDFMNYYTVQTGINSTQFFNQWYYGQGYPTFTIKYNFTGNTLFIKSTQSTSMPGSVPLFVTPMEYKITRNSAPDTVVRVTHSNTVEYYSFNLLGSVTGIVCDPNNWVINKVIGPTFDGTITGLEETENGFASISIGPNPTRNTVIISNVNANGQLEIFDIGGKKLLQRTLSSEMSVDLSAYTEGIYLFKFTDSKGIEKYSQRIVRQ